MTIQNASTTGRSLITTIKSKMPEIGKVQANFIGHILILMLSIRWKAIFLQFSRYGYMNEKSYRNNFETDIDWAKFDHYNAVQTRNEKSSDKENT